MERRHFELERGYLNIDNRGLCFTRSGNWQHALEAPERTRGQRPRRAMGQFFGIALILLGGLFSALMKGGHGELAIPFTIALIGLGAYKIYQALRHDLAPEFRIPFAKVRSLGTNDGQLEVHFMNGDMQEDRFSVTLPVDALALAQEAFDASRA